MVDVGGRHSEIKSLAHVIVEYLVNRWYNVVWSNLGESSPLNLANVLSIMRG